MTTITTDITTDIIAPSWKQVRAFARAMKSLDVVQVEVTEALASEPEERHLVAADEILSTWEVVSEPEAQRSAVARRLAQGESLTALGVDVRAAVSEQLTNRNRNWPLPTKAARFIVAARIDTIDTIAPNAAIESEPEAPVVASDEDLTILIGQLRGLGLSDVAIAAAMFVRG